jgi:hypothetical protein
MNKNQTTDKGTRRRFKEVNSDDFNTDTFESNTKKATRVVIKGRNLSRNPEEPAEAVVELGPGLIEDYQPVITKVNKSNFDSIKFGDLNIIIRDTMAYPKSIYGFHHYIHQSREKMSITSIFKGKKKVYNICNRFEENIDEYDKGLNQVSKEYFGATHDFSNAFLQMWEILFTFNLIDGDKVNSVSIGKTPGDSISAISMYRDKFFSKQSKNDVHTGYIVEATSENAKDKNISYGKLFEKDKRITVNKSGKLVLSDVKNSIDVSNTNLIVACGNVTWNNRVLQEQESFTFEISQIIIGIEKQAKGGHMVLKIYEMYTDLTVKLIEYAASLYNEVFIYKPYTSKKSKSDRYVVFKEFLDKDTKKHVAVLRTLLEASVSGKYVNDFFVGTALQSNFKNTIVDSNVGIGSRQFQNIYEIVDFINKENYRGDDYQNKRQDQINATRFWLNVFYPSAEKFSEKKERLGQYVTQLIDLANKRIARYNKLLVD